MIERYIDYMQFTANFNEWEFSPDEYETIRGLPYYPRGYKDASGTRFNFGENKGANCFVVLAGEQMEYFRASHAGDMGCLAWAIENGAKFSRLDLAVTEYIEDDLFTVRDVAMWYKLELISSSLCAGGCKKIEEVRVKGRNKSETLYIGDWKKRARKGLFRAYDKSVDMGIGNDIVSRIELELKRDKANYVAHKLAKNYDIAGNFRTYFNVKHETFERIMQAEQIEAIRGKGKPKKAKELENDNRWKWLMLQVAPALREAIENDYDFDLGNKRMFEFMSRAGIIADASKFADALAEHRTKVRFSKVKLLDN